ncbi:MAG: DNA polymerase III subunit delta [Candidatus Omnitrophota bacterium]|nr:DNA polymerase III subunit delta [Candidatus Omnitrophota bacterium]
MHNPIYVFLGRENALKEEALTDLKREVLSGADADLNYTLFYADQIEPREFQDAVNTQPFLSPKRFVVIKDIEQLPEPVQDSITNYCKNPSEKTVLVMTSDLEPKDIGPRKGDFFSSISRYATTQVFERLKEDKLIHYLKERAASNKKTISDEAISLLMEKLGDDLANIKGAIEELVTYVGARHNIEKDDVEALIGKSLEETVFTLTGAVCRGQASRSLSILSSLFRESVRPENIIGAIGAELRRLMKVKHLMAQGKNQWHIQSELRLSQQAASEAMSMVKRIKLDDIKKSFDYLLKADRDCKNRDLDKRVILESLIVRLSDLGELA